MAANVEIAAVPKTKRKTGDWRGFPWALTLLAVLLAVGAVIGVLMALSDGRDLYTSRSVSMDLAIAAILAVSAMGSYWLATVVAALRGILGNAGR